MERIGMLEARTHFFEFLRAVKEGREFVITNRGEEVALLLPVRRIKSMVSVRDSLDRLAALSVGSNKNEAETWNEFSRDGLKW